MRSIELALQGGAKVLTAGLIFGAGLPILYALAVRSLAVGANESVADDGTIRLQPTALGRALSSVFGLILVGAVASGMGKVVSFEHLLPVLVDKK